MEGKSYYDLILRFCCCFYGSKMSARIQNDIYAEKFVKSLILQFDIVWIVVVIVKILRNDEHALKI